MQLKSCIFIKRNLLRGEKGCRSTIYEKYSFVILGARPEGGVKKNLLVMYVELYVQFYIQKYIHMHGTLRVLTKEHIASIRDLQKSPSTHLKTITRIMKGSTTLGFSSP